MNSYLVVIDTNVLVSALISKHDDASTVRVLEALFLSKIIPLYNEEIIKEYEDVLHREKFGFSEHLIDVLIQFIYENGILVDRLETNEYFFRSKGFSVL